MPQAPRPKPARQKRSEARLKGIMQAAAGLLAKRDLQEISVADIAKAAGVPVGTFYQRFDNKDALIGYILQELQQAQLGEMAQLLRADRWAGVGLEKRIDWLIDQLVAAARAKPGLVRAIFSRMMTPGQPDAKLVAENNRRMVLLLSEWLLQRRDEIRANDPDAACASVVAWLSYSVHLALLYPFSFPTLDPSQAIEQLRRAALASLLKAQAQA